MGYYQLPYDSEETTSNYSLNVIHNKAFNNYFPSSKVIRKYISDGGFERYLTTGHERDHETISKNTGGTGYDNRGARFYDSDVARFLSLDPAATEYPRLSDYNYVAGNPIMFIDPDGRAPSKHIDESGTLIAKYDDGDNGVYMHSGGTTKEDIDDQRKENKNTGGTGKHIGDIGGNINIEGIMANRLETTASEANGMNTFQYFNAVRPGGKWDLKANANTIFGVAWSDHILNGSTTTFSFSNYINMSAADVGNYHAGYAGRKADFSPLVLWLGAGAAESAKSISEFRFLDLGKQINQMGFGTMPAHAPFGDRAVDFMWNTIEMGDASRTINIDMRNDE